MFIFSKCWFLGLLVGWKGKKWPKMAKIMCLTPNFDFWYDCDFWYTCVKWYLQQFFFYFFEILIFWVFTGNGGGKRAKNDLKLPISLCHALCLYFFKIQQHCKYYSYFVFYWPMSTVFYTNICFSRSSVNAKKKFWVVPHTLHICLIFPISRNIVSLKNQTGLPWNNQIQLFSDCVMIENNVLDVFYCVESLLLDLTVTILSHYFLV